MNCIYMHEYKYSESDIYFVSFMLDTFRRYPEVSATGVQMWLIAVILVVLIALVVCCVIVVICTYW